MLANTGNSGKMAPYALKAAGCATAFFFAGPAAAAMTAYGGDALLTLLDLSKHESLKEIPETFAGNLGNFIASAAYDRVKSADAGSLRGVFRDALAATLLAIRHDFLPTLPESDRLYYSAWFDRWASRLRRDDLPEFTDASLLTRFIRNDAPTVEQAVGPVLIEILIRLDTKGILQLETAPADPVLHAALIERLPAHLPIHISAALADRDKLWKIVIDQKLNLLLANSQPAPRVHHPNLLRADSPALSPRHDAFFGRTEQSAEIIHTLATPAATLVYVSGAPGIGKTELCKAALRQYLAADPSAAALFVDLSAATGLSTFLAACAAALGDLSLKSAEEVRHRLAFTATEHAGPLTVYLDNFESVAAAEGVLPFVRGLASFDHVRILCSTRLDLSAATGHGIHVHRLDPDSAAALFLHVWHRNPKAHAIERTPELDTFLRESLSHHALSIVLTASRGAFFRDLRRLILEWKAQGTRIATTVEQSLQTSLLLSWQILSDEQRQGMLLFALFPEGITSATWADLEPRIPDAWTHRARLAELSLIEDAPTGDGLSLLAPIREFTIEQARANGSPDWQSAIGNALDCYCRLAAAGSGIRYDAPVVAARLRMGSEFPNLAGFLERIDSAQAKVQEQRLHKLAVDLHNTYQFSPLPARPVAQVLVGLCESTGDQLGQAAALLNLGDLEFRFGRNSEARNCFERALQLYKYAGEQRGLANTFRKLGELEYLLGQIDDARDRFERALQLYESTGSQLGQANTLCNLGELEFRLGRNIEARDLFNRARQLHEDVGNQGGLANTLRNLGELEFLIGRNDDARSLLESALSLYEPIGDRSGLASLSPNTVHPSRSMTVCAPHSAQTPTPDLRAR